MCVIITGSCPSFYGMLRMLKICPDDLFGDEGAVRLFFMTNRHSYMQKFYCLDVRFFDEKFKG